MRQAIKKELLEGSRAYKFLIIFAVFVFFALMDPILNKMVLPEVLKSQFNNIGNDMLNQMLVTSQRDCVRGYLTDAFQIATLVVVLSLSSLVAGEIKNKTFIFPICSKNDFATLIISKMVVYGTYLILVATTCTLIDYAYAGALFGWESSSWNSRARHGCASVPAAWWYPITRRCSMSCCCCRWCRGGPASSSTSSGRMPSCGAWCRAPATFVTICRRKN